jgi:hypothetical protein
VALNQQVNIHFSMVNENRIWSSAVGTASGYGLDDQGVGVLVPVQSRIFISPCRSDLLWGPFNLLCSGYWGGKASGA